MSLLKVTLSDVGVILIAVSMMLVIGAIVLTPVSLYVPAYQLDNQILENAYWHTIAFNPSAFTSQGNLGTALQRMRLIVNNVPEGPEIRNYTVISVGIAFNATNETYKVIATSLWGRGETYSIPGGEPVPGGGVPSQVGIPYPSNTGEINKNMLLVIYYKGNIGVPKTTKPILVYPIPNWTSSLQNYTTTVAYKIATLYGDFEAVEIDNLSSLFPLFFDPKISPSGLGPFGINPLSRQFPILFIPYNQTPPNSNVDNITVYYPSTPLVILKFNPTSIDFNPLSPRSLQSSLTKMTYEYVPTVYTVYVSPYLINQTLGMSGDEFMGYAALSGSAVFMFTVSLIIVLPMTAQALAGRMRRTFAELRVRGADTRKLKRHLLLSVLLAAIGGSATGYAVSNAYTFIAHGTHLYYKLLTSVFLDKFTLITMITVTVIAAILYWRRLHKDVLSIPYTYALRPLEAVTATPPKLGWGTYLVLTIGVYHVARLLIGWSAIRELVESGGDLPIIVVVILFVAALIEFLTTPFMPILLAYGISKVIAAKIDFVGRIMSRSRRLLGEMAQTAPGIAKLMTPSLIGLAAVLILALTLFMPGVSVALFANTAAQDAVTPSLGAEYALVGQPVQINVSNLTSYFQNLTQKAPPGTYTLLIIQFQGYLLTTVQVEGTPPTEASGSSPWGGEIQPGIPVRTFIVIDKPDQYGLEASRHFTIPVKYGDWPTSLSRIDEHGMAVFSAYSREYRQNIGAPEGVSSSIGINHITGLYFWTPGQAFLQQLTYESTALVTGPWLLPNLENISNTFGVPCTVQPIYLSFQQPTEEIPGFALYSADGLKESGEYKIQVGLFKLSLGSDTMLIVTVSLMVLLTIIVALLVNSAMGETSPVFRLLRLRGADFMSSAKTIMAPWTAVTLISSLIGITAGLSLVLVNLRIIGGSTDLGFMRIPDFGVVENLRLYWYLGTSSRMIEGAIYPLLAALVVALLVLIAPLVYMLRVYRGTGPAAYRRGV